MPAAKAEKSFVCVTLPNVPFAPLQQGHTALGGLDAP